MTDMKEKVLAMARVFADFRGVDAWRKQVLGKAGSRECARLISASGRLAAGAYLQRKKGSSRSGRARFRMAHGFSMSILPPATYSVWNSDARL